MSFNTHDLTFSSYHHLVPAEESNAHKEERERFNKACRNHKYLTLNPPAFVGAVRVSELLRAGEPLTSVLCHCDLSDGRHGVSIQAGGNCRKGAPYGCIQRCRTIKNVSGVSGGFPSVLHLGVIDGAFCLNGNSSCATTADGYHPCQETTAEEGDVAVELLNDLDQTCERRDICHIKVPMCGSKTGVMEHVMERLRPEVKKNTSPITTHPVNWSNKIDGMDAIVQRMVCYRVFRSLDGSINAQIDEYNTAKKDDGYSIAYPEESIMVLGLANEDLHYISEDDDTMFKSIDNQKKTRKKRIRNRVDYFRAAGKRTGKYDPDTLLSSLTNMPPEYQEWVLANTKEMMDMHRLTDHNQLTVYHVLSVSGVHSVESQCKKERCSPTELMEMVTKMGAESLGTSVSELKAKGGKKSADTRRKGSISKTSANTYVSHHTILLHCIPNHNCSSLNNVFSFSSY